MSKLLALTLFVLSLSANADEWTTSDKQRESTYLALHMIDWAQTRNIARNSDKWREINPILGEHPSEDKVDAYFAVMALAHIAISDALRSKYRDTWQYVSIGFEVIVVGHNFLFGVGINF